MPAVANAESAPIRCQSGSGCRAGAPAGAAAAPGHRDVGVVGLGALRARAQVPAHRRLLELRRLAVDLGREELARHPLAFAVVHHASHRSQPSRAPGRDHEADGARARQQPRRGQATRLHGAPPACVRRGDPHAARPRAPRIRPALAAAQRPPAPPSRRAARRRRRTPREGALSVRTAGAPQHHCGADDPASPRPTSEREPDAALRAARRGARARYSSRAGIGRDGRAGQPEVARRPRAASARPGSGTRRSAPGVVLAHLRLVDRADRLGARAARVEAAARRRVERARDVALEHDPRSLLRASRRVGDRHGGQQRGRVRVPRVARTGAPPSPPRRPCRGTSRARGPRRGGSTSRSWAMKT